jgi:hypothetical protein
VDKDVKDVAAKIILKKNIVILTGGAIDRTAYIPDTGFDISYHKKISGIVEKFFVIFLRKEVEG